MKISFNHNILQNEIRAALRINLHLLFSCSGDYSHGSFTARGWNGTERRVEHLVLEGNFVMQVKLTASYFLTTDHPKSRLGQPVLVNRTTGEAFLPSDAFVAYESWQKMPAAQVVAKMTSWRDFSGEERSLIELFVGIQRQPEAPTSKVREESGTPRSVSLRALSR